MGCGPRAERRRFTTFKLPLQSEGDWEVRSELQLESPGAIERRRFTTFKLPLQSEGDWEVWSELQIESPGAIETNLESRRLLRRSAPSESWRTERLGRVLLAAFGPGTRSLRAHPHGTSQ